MSSFDDLSKVSVANIWILCFILKMNHILTAIMVLKLPRKECQIEFTVLAVHLSIESHFVGVHGPYELHRKEEQIKCTAFLLT